MVEAGDLERLQAQLLELREENCRLADGLRREQKKSKELESGASVSSEGARLAGSLGKMARGLSLLGKDGAAGREEELREEVETLRAQLVTQEEEFRLQQNTLMAELNKVVRHADSLQARQTQDALDDAFDDSDVTPTAAGPHFPATHTHDPGQDAAELRTQLQDAMATEARLAEEKGVLEAELEKLRRELDSQPPPTDPAQLKAAEEDGARLQALLKESEEERGKLAAEKAELSSSVAKARASLEEMSEERRLAAETADQQISALTAQLEKADGRTAELEASVRDWEAKARVMAEDKTSSGDLVKGLRADVSALNEKFRRKQEAYVQLSREKDTAYEDFKKRLDAMVAKKDSEAELLHKQITQMRNELKTIDALRAEKASLESDVNGARSEAASLRQQLEVLQIQTAEGNSANDVLSSQLQDAKRDVSEAQKAVQAAHESAEARKKLLDEMAAVLERTKAQAADRETALLQEKESAVAELTNQLDQAKKTGMERQQLKELLAEKDAGAEELKAQMEAQQAKLDEARREKEAILASLEEERKRRGEELAAARAKAAEALASQRAELESALKSGTEDGARLLAEAEAERRRAEDAEAALRAVEKKAAPLMKDLKRQAAAEAKRADKLQAKYAEALAELGHRRSPTAGFEELRAPDAQPRPPSNGHHNDSGSISGWSVVSGRGRDGGGDNESTCSTRDVEVENQELIGRLTELQRQKFELSQKVEMLEASAGAMAKDLVTKSDVITHYVKDRAANASPAQAQPGSVGSASSSPSHKAPSEVSARLRRLVDGLRVDLSAPDIRDTNKALQVMLEEALTKNIQLEKDMDLLSQEVARLSAPK